MILIPVQAIFVLSRFIAFTLLDYGQLRILSSCVINFVSDYQKYSNGAEWFMKFKSRSKLL
jgi:hypothetical protein